MMSPQLTRRQFALAAIGTLASTASYAIARSKPRSVADIEAEVGGRIGLFAIDTSNGRVLAHRADERFAMCSTFKWLLAAAVLARVERAQLSLDERISYGPDALLEYAPVTREHVVEGSMTLSALMEAAVTVSDNTAANLLLAKIGGPAGLTEFVRSLGDMETRIDRVEPFLNSNDPGDPRDTTSPRAMAGLIRVVLCGETLSHVARDRLLAWLRACKTGKERLRAGVPQDWIVGDKTGTGRHGAVNDVAIMFPPRRAPILVAAFLSDSSADSSILAASHASLGSLIAREFRA
jgi:beta-lactamase class A